MPKIMVRFEFVNKKGKKRHVRFPLDRQSYDAYYHPSVSKEWRDRMLLESYREFCAQKKYERMTCQFPVDDDGNEIEFPDDGSQTPIQMLECKERRELIVLALETMSKKQREAFVLVHLLGYSREQASKKMGMSFDGLRKVLKRAEKSLRLISKEKYL